MFSFRTSAGILSFPGDFPEGRWMMISSSSFRVGSLSRFDKVGKFGIYFVNSGFSGFSVANRSE